jgi:type II secretion system protein H
MARLAEKESTPTSDPGLYEKSMRFESGFTLLEVLVVLVIVSITATFITIGLDDHREAAGEVERLRLALESAAEHAEIQGVPVLVEFLPQGYRFSRFDTRGHWVVIGDLPILAEHRFQSNLSWDDFQLDGRVSPLKMVFGAAMPQFALRIGTSSGSAMLISSPTGAVNYRSMSLPDGQT